ncbi:MAG: hypothetical protein K5888_12380 [Lachnospiraceae bacterium]|nr:hypothetical protein [Lachnospiraceae bacterium]
METLRKIISNRIFHIFSLLVCVGAIAFSYYARTILKASFLTLYYGGYVALLISFLIFLCAYKHKDADTKTLVNETIPGYFFFLIFLGIVFILRG